MLSYDQAAAKKQWREAVRAVAEAIEDAGGVVNNVNEARLDAVEAWIGESRQWLLAGLRQGRIDVAKANRAMWAADELLYRIERVRERIWPAPGSEDTELGVLMELEVGHGETEVYAGVQA